MLGDKLGEMKGKIIGTRVLPGDDYRYLKMEMTFQLAGTVLGTEGSNVGTLVAFERIPGQMYAEGHGMVMTQDGGGAIWNSHGVGTMTGRGMGISFRGSATVQTNSEKLARLNHVLILIEQEVDEEGNVQAALWEWK